MSHSFLYFLIFQKIELSSPKKKKNSGANFPSSKSIKTCCEKVVYILRNGTFLPQAEKQIIKKD